MAGAAGARPRQLEGQALNPLTFKGQAVSAGALNCLPLGFLLTGFAKNRTMGG